MKSPDFIANVKPLREWLGQTENLIKSRSDEPELPLTSLPEFNRKIWGLPKGLTVIASRTSQGKSAIAAQWAFDLADQKKPTLLLSLEMTVESMMERLFCNVMEVNNYDLLTGGYLVNKEIQSKWESFKKVIQGLPLIITCGVGKNFQDINRLLEVLTPKPKCIIVDYVQNIARIGSESREALNEYIRKFREICLLNNIGGVLCSQINRGAAEGDYRPHLHQMKETGVLEEASDIVILLHYPYFYDNAPEKENQYELVIAKNRNGRTGSMKIKFKPEFYKFYEQDYSPRVDVREKQIPDDMKDMAEMFNGKVV